MGRSAKPYRGAVPSQCSVQIVPRRTQRLEPVMPQVHLVVLAVLLFLAAPTALQFTGHPPEPPPRAPPPGLCRACHCTDDGVADCSGVVVDLQDAVGDGWGTPCGLRVAVLDGQWDENSTPTTLAALPAMAGVATLSLKRRGLSNIATKAFVKMADLRVLDLSHNQLTADAVRADALRGLWNADSYEPLGVEALDLGHNALHSLPVRALEHLPNLTALHLDGNPLRVLDRNTQAALATAGALKVLTLSGCGLTDLPVDLALPRRLATLDLAANALSAVPRSLPASLRRLVLDANPIRTLGDHLEPPFVHLSSLEELSLSYMPALETVQAGAFFGLGRLRALSCSHNPALRRVDPAAFSHLGPSRTLTEVSLRNNSLTWLPPGLLAWRALTFLDVADNPWHCSCNFTRWAAGTLLAVNVNAKVDVRCSSPAELSGGALLNATSTACSPPLRDGVVLGRPSLFTNALLLALTMSLVATFVLLVRRLLPDRPPGLPTALLLGRAARPLPRSDSMKQPLYVAAPTAESDEHDHPVVIVPRPPGALVAPERWGDL